MSLIGTNDINIILVRNTIGESSNDVSELCRSTKVNMFSKYKPINHTKLFDLTPTDYQDAKYGVRIFSMTSPESNNNWSIAKPTSSTPKRLGDFRNYNHNAPVPLIQITGNSIHVNRFFYDAYGIAFDIIEPSTNKSYCLTIEDIAPEGGDGVLRGNYYLGAWLYDSSNNLVAEYYSSSKIEYSNIDMDGASISLHGVLDQPDILDLPAGNYTLKLFITNARSVEVGGTRNFYPIYHTSNNSNEIDVTIYSIQDVYRCRVEGITPSGGDWVDGSTGYKIGNIGSTALGGLYRFYAKIKLTNLTDQNTTIDKNMIYVFYDELTDWDGSTTRRSVSLASSGTIALGANEETEVEVSAYIDLAPSQMPTEPTSIVHYPNFEVYYGNGEDKEAFADNMVTCALNYDFD